MSLSKVIAILFSMCISTPIFASENAAPSVDDCPPEIRAELNKPIYSEEELKELTPLITQSQSTDPAVRNNAVRRLQEAKQKLDDRVADIRKKYPSCLP